MPEVLIVSLVDRMKMPVISAIALVDPQVTVDELARTVQKFGIQGCVSAVATHEMACRGCGCTESNACRTDNGPCHWVEADLCSACAARRGRRR